jgi:hypothetical protein
MSYYDAGAINMNTSVKHVPLFAVPKLDLSRLVSLAFGASEHPLYDEAEVQKMIAALPADPVAGMAELARQVVSINQTDSSNPGQRVRALMVLDVAAHDHWGRICKDYFAPNGTPAEGRDVGGVAFRLLLETATEFANSYAHNSGKGALESDWVRKNVGQIMLHRALWLARKFVLMNMLHHPNATSMWGEAHVLYMQAQEQGVLDTPLRALPTDELTTSIKQEYVRLFLMEIAGPDTMHGREIELAFRIAGRVAASVRLLPEPLPGALYAVVPRGASRPVSVRRLGKSGTALYLDTSGCLPQLQALIDRDSASEPSAADPLFSRQFTMRESCDMAHRLIEYWGANPPKRRAQRVALDVPIRLCSGFDSIVQAMSPLDQGAALEAEAAKAMRSRSEIDPRTEAAKAVRETEARLADASAAGLGVLVPRKYAAWARLGTLLAIYMEPGPDWIVGALRRISAEGDMLRLGIRILARRPRRGWFHLRSSTEATVRSHEERMDEDFLKFYQQGILLDVDLDSAATGEILVSHGVLKLGSRLEFPLESKVLHISPTAECEATRGFDRVALEVRSATPYAIKATRKEDEPDPWKWAR